MRLKIVYPDHVEALKAEPHGEFYRLREHSSYLPIAAGDIVSADGRQITGVVEAAPVFMVEAYFPIDTPPEVVRRWARTWRAATDVTQPTGLTLLISSQSHRWLSEVVEPVVWWMELVRAPGAEFDFTAAVTQG